MWRDPGTWIALGVSALFIVVGIAMHRVFIKVLKQGDTAPASTTPTKVSDHE